MDKGFVPILGHSVCSIIFGAIDYLVAKVARVYNGVQLLEAKVERYKQPELLK